MVVPCVLSNRLLLKRRLKVVIDDSIVNQSVKIVITDGYV
jgi:hypothetical protein